MTRVHTKQHETNPVDNPNHVKLVAEQEEKLNTIIMELRRINTQLALITDTTLKREDLHDHKEEVE